MKREGENYAAITGNLRMCAEFKGSGSVHLQHNFQNGVKTGRIRDKFQVEGIVHCVNKQRFVRHRE
jgi:hypothetical protein